MWVTHFRQIHRQIFDSKRFFVIFFPIKWKLSNSILGKWIIFTCAIVATTKPNVNEICTILKVLLRYTFSKEMTYEQYCSNVLLPPMLTCYLSAHTLISCESDYFKLCYCCVRLHSLIKRYDQPTNESRVFFDTRCVLHVFVGLWIYTYVFCWTRKWKMNELLDAKTNKNCLHRKRLPFLNSLFKHIIRENTEAVHNVCPQRAPVGIK